MVGDVDDRTREGKSGIVVMIDPDWDEDRVEDDQEGELPGDPVDHDSLSAWGGELIDDGSKQEDVDDRPNEEGPNSRGEVRLFDVLVDRLRGDHGLIDS